MILKFVAVMLDVVFFTLSLGLLISQDENKSNVIASATFILMGICSVVNAVAIFRL